MRIKVHSCLICLVALSAGRAQEGGSAPTLVAADPDRGPAAGGTPVTLTGTNFAAGATVAIGGSPATSVEVVSSTEATLVTPAHAAGAVDIVLTNPDGASAILSGGFTYLGTGPTLATNPVSPAFGPIAGGTDVRITGTNFLTSGTTRVTFGGTDATNVSVVNPTTIAARTPPHAAGQVTVVVINPDGQSASRNMAYQYLAPPTLASVAPNSGSSAGGNIVTITGTNFVTVGTTRVNFAGTAATNVTISSATAIVARTPPHPPGDVDVEVINPDGQRITRTTGFRYLQLAPAITGVSPNSGSALGNTVVTLTGINFVTSGTTRVTFGGIASNSVRVDSETSLKATTPAHVPDYVDIVVTNPDGQSVTRRGAFLYIRVEAESLSKSNEGGGCGTATSGSPVIGAALVLLWLARRRLPLKWSRLQNPGDLK